MKPLLVKVFFLFSIALTCVQSLAALTEITLNEDPASVTPQTNGIADSDVVRAYLEVQAQLHATQLALERNQREAEAAAVRSAQELNDRLQQIERSLNEQRARESQTMQSSNRGVLIVGGTFAGLGFLAMLLTAYFQWRGVSRLTEIAMASSNQSPITWPVQTLGSGEPAFVHSSEASSRLLGAVERLEKRILQLEQGTSSSIAGDTRPEISISDAPSSDSTARITLLLGKGQSLLNMDKPDEAITCFDEILAMDQNNTDALVKKGVALERLRKLNEAIECYDRAIAADRSVTIAYLYKGGVFNRMERFDEALQCYEQALRVQENGAHSSGTIN